MRVDDVAGSIGQPCVGFGELLVVFLHRVELVAEVFGVSLGVGRNRRCSPPSRRTAKHIMLTTASSRTLHPRFWSWMAYNDVEGNMSVKRHLALGVRFAEDSVVNLGGGHARYYSLRHQHAF